MKTNDQLIHEIIQYIDAHLTDALDLDTLSSIVHYSKYHISKMFTAITGLSLHAYIQRRRLSEAAKHLVDSDLPIIEIALLAGYASQRAFSSSFKTAFHCTPKQYRKQKTFYPIQLDKGIDTKHPTLMTLDVHFQQRPSMHLIGYTANTRFGFSAIGRIWQRLHAKKQLITQRTDSDYLIGVNDYTKFAIIDDVTSFTYFAGAQVLPSTPLPKGMTKKTLPAHRYVVFHFRSIASDSLEPFVHFIYQEWFPHSSLVFDESAPYDFVCYGEHIDPDGKSPIEYWVPIRNKEEEYMLDVLSYPLTYTY